MAKSLFAGIKDAKPNQGGIYFLEGTYRVKVLKVHTFESRKKDDLFIVECEVLESSIDTRRPGMKPSWVVNLSQDAALGNIKGFICAAMGVDESEVDEEAVELACSPENPLKDTELALECVNIKTREGNPFTLHKWSAAA